MSEGSSERSEVRGERRRRRREHWHDGGSFNGSGDGSTRGERRVRRSWRASDIFSVAALVVASLTVACSAWHYGGVVARGYLMLQCGALLSGFLLLGGSLVSGRLPRRVPLVVLPLLGLGVLSALQLLPIWRPTVLSMEHAVYGELAGALPATAEGGEQGAGVLVPRAAMPGRTRLAINQLLSLVLLGFVFFETTGTPLRAVLACVPLVVSGVLMAVVGLGSVVQLEKTSFAYFVNPNNAAGWFLVCLSAAFFCAGFTFSKAPPLVQPTLVKTTRRERVQYAIGHLARRIGEMTAVQAAACLSCVLFLCAIIGTLSRAGITAGIVSVVVFFASRVRTNRWVMSVVGLSLLLLLSLGLLLLLDLDTPVVSELETLKDPVSATTIRLLHWSDSIRSVLDFPILGSGYASYADAALPYSRHFTNNVFARADNYYLELLVECGFAGLLLGAMPVFLSFFFALRMVFASESIRGGVRRSCGDWAGSAVLCLLFSLGGQNVFDFSIALSGIASGVVMLLSILERRFEEARSLAAPAVAESGMAVDSTGGFWRRLAERPLSVTSLWAVALAGSLFLLRDCWSAASVQQEFLEVYALIREPEPGRLIEAGDRLLAALNGALAKLPDDETLRRHRVLLMMRLAEREMYIEALGGTQLDPPQQRQLFRAVGFHALALRFLTVDSAEDRRLFVEAARRALQKYPWTVEAWKLLRESPLATEVAVELLSTGVFEPLQGEADLLVNQVLFAEPNSADRLAALGEYLVLTGEAERGVEVWQHSLNVSERFRPGILTAAAGVYGVGAALEMFAPTTFESAALAAERLPNGELRQAMLEDAERYWEEGAFRLTVPLSLVRAEHLRLQGRADEAVDFLQEQLLQRPGNMDLLLRRAQVLEQAGRNSDAYDEWVRIRELDPGHPDLEKSLTRLSRLPPTSVPEDAGVREFEARRAEEAEKKAEEKAEKRAEKTAEDRRAKKRESVSPDGR
ncbi:MAG: O-antigen ligase family protein [Planctomycetota bacterium]